MKKYNRGEIILEITRENIKKIKKDIINKYLVNKIEEEKKIEEEAKVIALKFNVKEINNE